VQARRVQRSGPGGRAWYVLMTMRLTRAARCSGVTAISAMIVEQLGLATMPPRPALMPAIAPALTSGITSGTPSVMRNAELLSTTCTRTDLLRTGKCLWPCNLGQRK